jgi:hypothetical protein
VVVRSSNRLRFLSSVLTAISLELKIMMIVWGDTRPASVRASNVLDFRSLADAISQSSIIRKRGRA